MDTIDPYGGHFLFKAVDNGVATIHGLTPVPASMGGVVVVARHFPYHACRS